MTFIPVARVDLAASFPQAGRMKHHLVLPPADWIRELIRGIRLAALWIAFTDFGHNAIRFATSRVREHRRIAFPAFGIMRFAGLHSLTFVIMRSLWIEPRFTVHDVSLSES